MGTPARQSHPDSDGFPAAVQGSPVPMAITRLADAVYLVVNDAFCAVVGYPREELIGRSALEVASWEYPEAREEMVATLRADGRVAGMESKFRRGDGSLRDGRFSANVVTFEGEPSVFIVIEDVTEPRQTAARLRSLVENMPAVTYTWDARRYVDGLEPQLFVSAQIEELLGYTAEEWNSQPFLWQQHLYPDDRDLAYELWARSRETREPFRHEYRMTTRDGRLVWIRDECHYVGDDEDGYAQWQGLFFDVTERKRIEIELRASEERFRTLVERIPAMTFIEEFQTERRGNPIRYMSPQIERVLGISVAERLANPASWESCLHPEDRDRVIAADVASNRTGHFVEDYRMIRPNDGKVIWIHEDTRVIDDPDGSPAYWLGVMFDVTEHREQEEERRRNTARFQGLYQIAQGLLAARMSEEVASTGLSYAAEATGCDAASVVLLDEDTEDLTVLAIFNNRSGVQPGSKLPLPLIVDRALLAEGRAQVLQDISVDPGPTSPAVRIMMEVGVRSVALVPLTSAGHLIGMLVLSSDTPAYFTEEHAGIAREIADMLAVALHQAELRGQAERYADELESTVSHLRRVDQQRRDLLARLVRAQEEERQRIASDIHDDSVQKMVATNLRLEGIRRRVTDPDALAALDQMEVNLRDTITRLRHLMFELWPHTLDRYGLAAALEAELEELQDTTGIRCSLDSTLSDEPEEEIRTIAFRIAQEALQNVGKHAKAANVAVELRDQDDGVLVRITDDGAGFESMFDSPRGHLGLSAMRERAEMAAGWVRIDSRPGTGTTVECWLPRAS